jgi:hypothetical protein
MKCRRRIRRCQNPGDDPSPCLIRSGRHPACRRREAGPGFRMERENLHCVTPFANREGESTDGLRCSALAWANWRQDRTRGRGKVVSDPQAGSLGSLQACKGQPGSGWRRRQSIEDFEASRSGNLYKLWNRMSSGSYFPRRCGASRLRKQVVASGRWAYQRSPTTLLRKSLADIWSRFWGRCFIRTPLATSPASLRLMPWRNPRALLALRLGARSRHQGLFDSIDWELLLKAVRQYTDCAWVLLYIERWLKASVQMEDRVVPRQAGTPQCG